MVSSVSSDTVIAAIIAAAVPIIAGLGHLAWQTGRTRQKLKDLEKRVNRIQRQVERQRQHWRP
jgi:hypothetical protein